VMGSLVELTKASRVARMGVLQGEATSAKVSPARYACSSDCVSHEGPTS